MVEHLNRAHAATGSKDPIRASFLRLAELPSRSTLRFPPPQHGNNAARILWPILQCNNVFVLPGVPEFFSDKITAIAQHFIHPKQAFFSRRVLLALEEKDIVATLDASVAAHPHGQSAVCITTVACVAY
jgi:molybdopterin-biosynthesis enzyme MoeA-like protein